MKLMRCYLIGLAVAFFGGCQGVTFPHTVQVGQLGAIDAVVVEEMAEGNYAGAVVLVGQGDKILYHKCFGNEVVEPYVEPMTNGTIFDMASVSKPVGTATSILILWDRGKIDMEDRVGEYLPEFAVKGKEEVRLKHLLTHTSGLPAYTNAAELKKQYGERCPEKVIEKICSFEAMNEPGETYRYSCLGYITLAKIVEVVSGQTIDEFARDNIFEPLKMKHTTYNPPKEWEKDIAATEIFDGQLLRGFVHDPLAQLNGGISGNAGLFSNATDLSIYCRMVLNGGIYQGVRILSPEAVHLLTRPQTENRSFGFGFTTSYSWIKDEDAVEKSISHLGYTGTALVYDPINQIYLIILTNRVHPQDKGDIGSLRNRVAEIMAQALVEN